MLRPEYAGSPYQAVQCGYGAVNLEIGDRLPCGWRGSLCVATAFEPIAWQGAGVMILRASDGGAMEHAAFECCIWYEPSVHALRVDNKYQTHHWH